MQSRKKQSPECHKFFEMLTPPPIFNKNCSLNVNVPLTIATGTLFFTGECLRSGDADALNKARIACEKESIEKHFKIK